MLRILKLDKFPYFLSALFGIVVLQFNYTLDSIFKIPILEYKFENGEKTLEDTLTQKILVIKNISNDKIVKEFHIQLKFNNFSSSVITCPDIDAIPPATIIQGDPRYTQNKLVYYHIPIIQPGLSYRLKYFTNEDKIHPILKFECNDPIKIIEKSFYSFFLRNQFKINIYLMFFFILLSIIYILQIKNDESNSFSVNSSDPSK